MRGSVHAWRVARTVDGVSVTAATGVPVATVPGATWYPQGAVLVELDEALPMRPATVRDQWSDDPDRTTRRGDVADPRVRAWLDAGWL